jgi:hypothetical protein
VCVYVCFIYNINKRAKVKPKIEKMAFAPLGLLPWSGLVVLVASLDMFEDAVAAAVVGRAVVRPTPFGKEVGNLAEEAAEMPAEVPAEVEFMTEVAPLEGVFDMVSLRLPSGVRVKFPPAPQL